MANPNSAQNFKEADFSDLERSILSCAFCHQGPIDDELCEGGRLYIYRPPGGAKAVAKAKKAALKRLQEQKKPKKKGRNNRNDEVITLDSSDFSDSDDEIDVDEGELCFHYFCVLFSAQIQQRGIRGSERNSIFAQNHAGLFGFLIDDILSEIERTKSNECHFCPSFNANIQCKKKGCKTKFHYQCGEGNGSQYVFSDDFPSYCPQHRIDFEKLLPKTKAFPVSDKTCLCCLEKVTVPLKHLLPKFSSPDFLVSPCCGRTFHRLCIQKLAITEGSARFQCPNCEEQSLFGLSMRRCGIYVPIRETVSQESPGSRRPGRNGNGHSPSPRGRGRGRGRGAAPASSGNGRPPGPASRGRPSGPASRGRGMAPPSRGPSSSRSSTSPAPLPKLTISKGNRGSWKASIHDDSDEEFNLDSVMKEVNASPKRRNSRNVSKPARFRSPNAVNMSDDDDDEEEFIPKGPPKSFDAISSPGRPSPRTRGPPPKISPSLKYKKYRDLSSDSSRSPSPEVIAMPSPRTTPSRGRGRGRGRGSRSSAPSPASSVGSGSVTSVTPSSRPGPKSRSSRSSRASTPDPLDDVPLSRSGRGRRAGPSPKAAPRQPPKPSPRTASRGKKTPAKKGSARRGKKDDFSSGESSDGGNFVEDLPTFDDADSDDYTPATVPTPSRTSRTRGKPTTSFAHLLLDDSDDEAPLSFNVNSKSSAKKTGPASKGDASPDILQSFRHSVVPSNRPGPASRKSDVSPPVFAKKTAPASRPGPKSRSAPKEPSPPPPSRGSRGRLGPKSRIAEREPSPEIKSTKTSRAGPKSRVPTPAARASRKKSNEEDPLSLSAFDAVATGSTRRGARASAKAAPSNLGVDPLAITSEDLDLGTKSGRKGPAANGRPGPASRRGATPSSKDKFEEAFNKLKEDRAKSSVEPVTPGKRKRGEATPTSPKLPEKKIKAAMGPRSAMSKRKRQNSSDEEIVEIVEERKSSKPAPKRKQDGAAKPGPASARPGPKSQKPGPASRTSALKRKREPERQVDKKKARLELLACSKDVTNLVLEDILLATEEAMIKSKTFATETCSDWIKEDLLGSVFAESTQYCSTVMDDVVLDSLFVLFGPPSSFHVTEDKNADKYLLALKPPKVKVQDCVNTDKMPFDATAIFCRDILIDEVVYPAKKEVDSRFLNEMCKRVTGDIVEHALLDSTRHCAKNILEDIIFDEACYRAMGPPKTLDLKHEKAPKIIDKLKCTLPLQDMFTRPDGKFPTEANGIFCMDILVDEVVYPAKDEIDDRFIEGVAKGQVDTLLEMLFKESTQYCSTVLDKVVDEAGYRLFGPPNRLNLNHELAPMILEKTSKATLKVEDCFAKEPYPTEANFSFCMDILVEEAVYPAKEEIDANFMEKMCSGIVTHIVDDLVFAESAQYCQKELLEDTIMDEAAYRLFGPPLRLPLGHVKAPKILGKLQNHYLKIEDCIKKPQMPREAVKIICDDLMDEIVLNTEEEIISRPFFKYKQVNDAIIDTLVAMPMKWKTIREREKWRLSVIGDSIKSILLDVPKSDDFATRLTSTHKFAGDMCFQIMVEDVADSATKLFIERKEAREAELRRPKPFSIKCKDLYAEKKLHPEASRFLGETTVLSIVNDAEGVLAERPFFGKKLISDLLGSMVSESVAQAAHRKKEGSRKRGHSSSTSKSIGNSGNDLLFDSPAKRSRKTVIEEHDEESSITIVHDIKLECFSDSESSNASNTLRRKRKRSSVASNLKGEALFDSLFGGSASNGDSSGVGTNGVMSNENGESNGIEIIE